MRSTAAASLIRAVRLGCTMALGALLLACGGGFDLAGGVGSGGSGMAEGRVSGFGSIFVDGTEYDDSAAVVRVQGPDGQASAATTRLGQRVRMQLDAQGRPTAIEVLPQLLGPVAAVESGWLQVAGQWVKVHGDTVVADFASAAAVAPGDEVEVHGAWVTDAARGPVLQASRIEPRGAPAGAPLLVSGIVHALRSEGGRSIIVLNREGGTEVRSAQPPAGLVVGQLVSAWVQRPATTPGALDAIQLRPGEPLLADGQTLVLGGPARAVGNGRIAVQGVTAVLPPGMTFDVTDARTFVQLTVRRQGDRWEVVAIRTRGRPEDLGGRVVLKGTARTIDWTVRPLLLAVRNTLVEIPPAVLSASNCPGLAIDPLQLEIVATPGRQPLAAVRLQCSATPSSRPGASTVDQLRASGSSPRKQ